MTNLVDELDNAEWNTTLPGENGSMMYGWGNNIKEKIVQLHFQLVRNKNGVVRDGYYYTKQGDTFEEIYRSIFYKDGDPSVFIDEIQIKERNTFLDIMHKLVAYTRDIIHGKGEYMLSYDLVYRISKYNPYMAANLIYYFVNDIRSSQESHPFGSWKDIKYMWVGYPWCKRFRDYFIRLLNNQLYKDYYVVSKQITRIKPTLVSKWIPRENSKFKELFYVLAENYYPYVKTAKDSASIIIAKKKSYTHYRKLLSYLNKHIDTTQVKQCSKAYSAIDFKNVTGITHHKQKDAFLNRKRIETRNLYYQRSVEADRIECSEKYKAYVESCLKDKKNVKGKRVGIVDLVKHAIRYENSSANSTVSYQQAIINSQWNDIIENIGSLHNFIAMVDTSGSMKGDPLHAAIGLGICVAEKSKLGNRVLTFDKEPSWINLKKEDSFCSKVSTIMDASWGLNTNFTIALIKILDGCVSSQMTEEEVSNLVLVIFSDMQIDNPGNEVINEPMWNHIKSLYLKKGYSVIPHILFWNLRYTEGFPVMSEQIGSSMFSGFSPSLLNTFSEKGMEGIKNSNPWSNLMDILDKNGRYGVVENDRLYN